MNHLVADLYRWSWEGVGFLKCSAKLLQQMKARNLNIEQWAHWLPIQENTNQLSHMIMMSLGQIKFDLSDCANWEFHARTLYMSSLYSLIFLIYVHVSICIYVFIYVLFVCLSVCLYMQLHLGYIMILFEFRFTQKQSKMSLICDFTV